MPYRNSLRRGPPKKNESEAGRGAGAAAQTPKRNARTASNATKGATRAAKGRRANERADNGDAHEPTGLTSDEDSESESGSDEEDDASEASEVSDSDEADGETDAFEPSASEQEVEEDIESDASEDIDATPKAGRKRGAAAKAPAAKKRKKAVEEGEEEDEDDIELEPGQKIVARIKVYPAPKTGQGGCFELSLVSAELTDSAARANLTQHARLPDAPPVPEVQHARVVQVARADVPASGEGVARLRASDADQVQRGRRPAASPPVARHLRELSPSLP